MVDWDGDGDLDLLFGGYDGTLNLRVIAVGVVLEAELVGQDDVDVTRSVQYANNLDAVGNGSVEDKVFSEAGDRKKKQASECGMIALVAGADPWHVSQSGDSGFGLGEETPRNT
jgi:hypothetical protein